MSRNRGIYLIVAGLATLLAGLAWDISIHSAGEALSSEELFTIENPGHVLLGLGIAMVVAGAALGLIDSQASLRAFSVPSIAAVLLLTAATGVFAYGMSSGIGAGHTHTHGVTEVPGISQEDVKAQLKAAGLSEQDIELVETSRHEHDPGVSLSLDAADLEKLAGEVAEAMDVGSRYTSLDTALAQGYIQITQDLPLIGAHFINLDYANDGKFDIEHPEMLIYHFENGAWRFYGLSYLTAVIGYDGEQPPEGFTGPYDVWHWHEGWCFTLKGARKSNGSDCKTPVEFYAARTGYMVHVWYVDNPLGVFSHSHPGLTGSSEYMPAKDIVVALLRMQQTHRTQ
ncbi:MAG TPA: hypothetical protein VFX19_00280 [Dehalococcoidia bacterium]|nr:hypothetical protein [Dehalococcoidia bacterium]